MTWITLKQKNGTKIRVQVEHIFSYEPLVSDTGSIVGGLHKTIIVAETVETIDDMISTIMAGSQ